MPTKYRSAASKSEMDPAVSESPSDTLPYSRPTFRQSMEVPAPVSTAANTKNIPAPITTENPSKMVESPASAPNPMTNARLSTSAVMRLQASAAANMEPAMPSVENRYICST